MSIKKATIDGNTAAAHVAYAFSDVAAIYPITPSSNMGELADSWAAAGRKNIFGEEVEVIELQSEGGASGAVHGALTAGSLTTTFTASQGLLLMIPNMHKIAGEMLPTVFHVSARSLACQSLSIFGDHSDVMSVRNTGFALVAAASVQETMDLAVASHLATLESKVPFLNFFDGFRTSHEIQKVEMIDYETMASLLDMKYVEDFRGRALTPDRPVLKVGQQTPDVYFQGRETVNRYYEKLPAMVQKYMDQVAKKTGRAYHLFDYVGHAEADRIVVAMGSACETIEETVEYLNKKGSKLGLIKVRLYRPFALDAFLAALPRTVKKIAVLDRTKEPGALGEPLYMDVATALANRGLTIIGGRYGLSSKEFTPAMVQAVFDHLDGPCFHDFTVGINDDVSKRSIPLVEGLSVEKSDTISCIFWGLGSDGTVGANKNSIKIIGDHTDMYAQGYFSYDSKKSGGITISYLRFGKSPIRAPYLSTSADFIALHNPAYIGRYDVLKGIKEGGTFLLNSEWSNDEVFEHLTRDMQETIITKKVKFYNIDALKISDAVGLGKRINTVMQVAFFKISGVLPGDEAIQLIKDSIKKSYEKKGETIVKMNWDAVDRTSAALQQIHVPATVKDIQKSAPAPELIPDSASEFARTVVDRMMHLQGDSIPVSWMPLDGKAPTATAKLEKRGIAPQVPHWISANCIQCNQCSLVCPHAAIRAKQIEPAQLAKAPATFKTVKSTTKNDKNLEYKIQVYIEDCTGCGNCVHVCPAKTKALEFRAIEDERQAGEDENFAFFEDLPDNIMDGTTIAQFKGVQFRKPLFEFSGACAGCGETPYVKLVSQLFGERMIIANATGCHRLLLHLQRYLPHHALLRGQGRARPRLGQFAVRGQRRIRPGHAPGRGRQPQAAARRHRPPAGRRRRCEAGSGPEKVHRAVGRHHRQGAGCGPGRARTAARRPEGRSGRQAGRLAQGHRATGLPGRQVGVVHRRRRLGLRHRLRRPGPRAGHRQERQRPGAGHRGLLQHRRPGLQSHAAVSGGPVRLRGQAHRQEGPGADVHELRLRLCGLGGHGRQHEPGGQGHAGSRGLPRARDRHRLLALHHARL